jgi:beta-aspartyl-peptidase (threonine type)
VSATGDGEAIIRAVASHEVAALVRHRGLALADACERVLSERLAPLGGDAGLIAVDPAGNVAMGFNTALMHRGVARSGSEPQTALW